MKQVEDERGVVREFYRESSWLEQGLPSLGPWLQINVTESRTGSLRGLHGEAMHKLVAMVHGTAFGPYVDVRPSSPTFRRVVTLELTTGRQSITAPCADEFTLQRCALRHVPTQQLLLSTQAADPSRRSVGALWQAPVCKGGRLCGS